MMLAQNLPDYINTHHAGGDGFSCRAAPIDLSFGHQPTLCVTVTQDGQELAVYKLNILDFAAEGLLAFSPLVVTWAAGVSRGAGTGQRVTAHCTAWLAAAQKQGLFSTAKILLTSGNLTAGRAGRPFFTALGWEIVTAQTAGAGALRVIAQRLETMAAPFQKTEADADAPISFACRWFVL